MSKPTEKKTVYTPEHNLKRGITNRSIDCVRAYLSEATGKNVILSPDARNSLRTLLNNIALAQDAKFDAAQTAFGHPKNWNVDFVADRTRGKQIRVFVPIKKIVRVPKPVKAKVVAAAITAAPTTGKGKSGGKK